MIGSIYGDNFAVRFNGTSQYAWRANPEYKSWTAGAIGMWVRFPALLASDGVLRIFSIRGTGTGSEYWTLSLRRNASGYGNTNCYIDIAVYDGGTAARVTRSNNTPIAANTWYHIGAGSGGNLLVNAGGSLINWSSPNWTGQWFGAQGYTTPNAAFGADRVGTVASIFGRVDINNVIIPDRAITGTEWMEHYNAGMAGDPRRLSFASAIKHGYGMESSPRDDYGVGAANEPLTLVGTPLFVAP